MNVLFFFDLHQIGARSKIALHGKWPGSLCPTRPSPSDLGSSNTAYEAIGTVQSPSPSVLGVPKEYGRLRRSSERRHHGIFE